MPISDIHMTYTQIIVISLICSYGMSNLLINIYYFTGEYFGDMSYATWKDSQIRSSIKGSYGSGLYKQIAQM